MTTSEPTTGEIVRALGNPETLDQESLYYWSKVAADRLESQEREIVELKQSNLIVQTGLSEQLVRITDELTALTARAEQAERERDAAIKDIEMVTIDNICYGCISYKNGECSRCDNRCVPKWRGLPQEGEEK